MSTCYTSTRGNIPGRNYQVQFMRDIYEHAARVVIWLGTLDRNISRVEGIQFHNWMQINYEQLHLASKLSSESRTLGSLSGEPNIKNTVENNLRLIFMKPWWSRVWIIQEVACAKVAVVHLGMSSAVWEALLWISRLSIGYSEDTVYQLDIQRMARVRGSRESLFDLTYQFRHSKSTDPRDKDYALVGLAKTREK
jgi:Heterokaryon incompatibility protein (HET)